MERIKLFFAGDFVSKSSTKIITVSSELRNMIQSCDLKVVNFEVPLKAKSQLPKQKRERFWQHDDAPVFLKELGFGLFSTANNHAFDQDEDGWQHTIDVFSKLGIIHFGSGGYDEAYKMGFCEVNGIKIGFMALSFAAYKGVFCDTTNHDGLGCAYINDLRVNHDIIAAKKEVDYLFILPHDGIEYIDIPMPETIARYRDFIDYGADGVIGTHPHCPQGWEEYRGKPIFYSLGNFLFNSVDGYNNRTTRPHWYEGLCVVMTIADGKLDWEVVNTRNVDNVGIEIDHDETRNKHNETICQYLTNKEKYNSCLKKICNDMGMKEMTIIDKTIHPQSLKECTKLLLTCWKDKIRGKNKTNDYSLLRLLTHDARRNLLMWTMKLNTRY